MKTVAVKWRNRLAALLAAAGMGCCAVAQAACEGAFPTSRHGSLLVVHVSHESGRSAVEQQRRVGSRHRCAHRLHLSARPHGGARFQHELLGADPHGGGGAGALLPGVPWAAFRWIRGSMRLITGAVRRATPQSMPPLRATSAKTAWEVPKSARPSIRRIGTTRRGFSCCRPWSTLRAWKTRPGIWLTSRNSILSGEILSRALSWRPSRRFFANPVAGRRLRPGLYGRFGHAAPQGTLLVQRLSGWALSLGGLDRLHDEPPAGLASDCRPHDGETRA